MTREAQRLVEDNHNLIYKFLRNHNLEDDWYDVAAKICAKQQIIITPINISFLHMRINVCITKCGKIIGDIRT